MLTHAEAGRRTVYHPGWVRVGLLVSVVVLVAAAGATTAFSSPFTGWSLLGLGLAATCTLIGANLIGMRIVVDSESVTKVYLFGLMRSSIPLGELRASYDRSSRNAGSVDFEGAGGTKIGFSLSPVVWRSRDIAALYALAADTEYRSDSRYELKPDGREKDFIIEPGRAYPVLLDGESGRTVGHCKAGGSRGEFWVEPDFDPKFPHKEIGFFAIVRKDEGDLGHLKEVVLITPTGSQADTDRRSELGWLTPDPDPDHYDLELGRFKESFQFDTDITCAVRLGTARGPKLGDCRVGDLGADAWVEPHFQLPMPADAARFYASWDIDSDGLRHLREVILVAKGAKPPPSKPVGRQLGDTDEGWMLILSGVAFLSLLTGISIAIGSGGHAWPVDVAAGAFGYVVFIAYSSLATRVPKNAVLLRLVRIVSVAVAITLPVAIWLAVHGLPCPPDCH